jgi:hypothetical protein
VLAPLWLIVPCVTVQAPMMVPATNTGSSVDAVLLGSSKQPLRRMLVPAVTGAGVGAVGA